MCLQSTYSFCIRSSVGLLWLTQSIWRVLIVDRTSFCCASMRVSSVEMSMRMFFSPSFLCKTWAIVFLKGLRGMKRWDKHWKNPFKDKRHTRTTWECAYRRSVTAETWVLDESGRCKCTKQELWMIQSSWSLRKSHLDPNCQTFRLLHPVLEQKACSKRRESNNISWKNTRDENNKQCLPTRKNVRFVVTHC